MRRHPVAGLSVVVLAASAALVAGAGPAAADASTPLYVRNTYCSDSGPGSQDQPYCTISAAVAAVLPGQTINVTGQFAEHVTIAESGASGHPIVLQGVVPNGMSKPLLFGGFTIDGQHDVSIIGIDVNSTTTDPGIAVSHSTRILLQDDAVGAESRTTDVSAGIQLAAVTDSSLIGDRAGANYMSTGLAMDAATTGVLVKSGSYVVNSLGGTAIDVAGSNNTVIDNTASGWKAPAITIDPGANNNIIANNVVRGVNGGIYNTGATGTALTNNTVTNTCATGIRVAGASSGVSVENNVSASNPSTAARCSPPDTNAVDIGIYDGAVNNTVVDYNTVYQSVAGTQPYAWNNTPMSLADFQNASGQAAHDLYSSDPSVNIDSANSAAPGYQGTDSLGHVREDDPAVQPNTGAGPISYADRGATEAVLGPTAKLAVALGQTSGSITADASGSTPGWTPISSYTFDFGDGSTVTQSTPKATHQYTKLAGYTVKVTVTDSASLTSSDSSATGCVAPPVAGSGTQRLTADFNGDGRDDVASLYDYGGGHVAVFTMTGRGCGQFDAPLLRWDGPWWGTGTKFMMVGDVNGDGKADIVLFYDYGGGHVAVFTLLAHANGDGGFAAPALAWNGPWWGGGTKFASVGDFNGDGKRDLALFYDYGGGHVAVFTLAGDANGHFAAPVLRWNGPWWGPGTKFASAGDFNGDGKDDLALFYDYGGGHVAVFTLPASGVGLSAPVLRWNGPWWGSGTTAMTTGHVSSDTRNDLILFYTYTPGSVGLFTLAAGSSGDGSLAAPTSLWGGSWGMNGNRHRFMAVGSFVGAGKDSIALFHDDWNTAQANLDTINPDTTGAYSAPTPSWENDYWGYGTVAFG